jgi:serine/threonine protein kinase/Tol biopolymer transport system component/Tfp pilus assembly protein PilF
MAEDSRKPTVEGAEAGDNHWAELKALFDSAILLDPPERQFFIENECGPNTELRRELESLLLAYEETGSFLEQPAASVKSFANTAFAPAGTVFPSGEDERTVAGSRVGAYLLEREIGRGGMGAVFLATRADGEFTKRVAIKLIRSGRENDFAVHRFRRERQILARLENQYVARLIDGGSTDTGSPYFVMEYVEGKPVTDFCEERALDTCERLELFLKICSAVQYAHERNIIHRDLKPGNILVKADGTPKLLDFGIAKILGADSPSQSNDATIAGFRMLTPAYASPEQMRGESATERSDVYSLGVILYELLYGERPSLSTFQRSGSGEANAGTAHLSANLRAIVFHAIQWHPNERYGSVKALAADIQRYLTGEPPQADSLETGHFDATPAQISIAILPFRFLDSGNHENAFLAPGIAEALVSRLSRVERLSVRPTSSTRKYADGSNAAKAARELKVKYILEGSLHVVDDCVRVSVQLVYSEASVAIWAAQFDEPAKDLIKLEDSLAEQVAFALIPHLTGEEREQISKSGTGSGKAHEAYLRGRWHWSRSTGSPEELTKALLCFQQAIAEDPHYARAHAGMADYYLRLGLWGGLPPSESFAAAVDAAEQAVRLDPSLGEAHASLGFALWACKRDYAAAEQHFNLAIIRNPDYGSAHHWFGLLNSARNQPELAIANLERACKVEPNSPVIMAALGFVHYNARQFEKAIQLLLQAARELRNSAVVQEMLAWCYLGLHDLKRALEAARQAVVLSERSPSALATLAQAESAGGNQTAALPLWEEIETTARAQYVPGYYRASAFLAVGDTAGALKCLQQSYADGDWWICWIAVEPRWDALRSNGRFKKLVEAVQPLSSEESAEGRPRRKWMAIAAFMLLACVLASLAGLALWQARNREGQFENPKITKLTSNGTANAATISPDGKYVAYTVLESGNTSLWLRDLSTGRTTAVAGPFKGAVEGLSFTRRGAAVSFVNYDTGKPSSRRLFLANLSGGAPQPILGPFAGGGAITEDGNQVALLERIGGLDELWIQNLKTGQRRLLKTYHYPQRFAEVCLPAWSSDGRTMAYALEERDKGGFLISIKLIDTATGSAKNVRSPRWQEVHHISWTGDGSALAVAGHQLNSSFQQIWYLPLRGGRNRRIGDDLDNYLSVSLAAKAAEMVSVQIQTVSNIYVMDPAHAARSAAQITPGSGRYFDLSWAPDGRILYASDATGSADLWIMNPDGSGVQHLTSGAARNYAPVMSPDGRFIAFHSNRSGNWQIWRANADGSNPKQLSQSSRDANWPQFTRDSKLILYHQTDLKGSYNDWEVPADGGSPIRLTTALTMHPAVSPKDGRIASWWSSTVENPHWRLAIFSPKGGEPLRVFDPTAATYPDTTIHWTPSGNAIVYLDHANGIANLWIQPVNGGAPHRLTNFTSGNIYSFDWSKDGKLVYSRGLTTTDVVLIKDTSGSEANSH